ncbi:uncharacterized protein LOC128964121 [Oppia nitens]|uniref:uncharacterized protein LOC128964121 n=1 Tax=Oppia nitens TaxID=1686743 RepID=UPI0023DAE4DC|nr:uncharacterized protein LOC128964121 [Oppia nitens]
METSVRTISTKTDQMHTNFIQVSSTPNTDRCPSGPPVQWKSLLDVASKAYLAPIVFTGKLISITEDYSGRIGATFQVKKLIKNQSLMPSNVVITSHVTLYFVRNKSVKPEPPYCAIYLDNQLIDSLRPQEKYIIFAATTSAGSNGITSNSVHYFNSINSNNSNVSQHHQNHWMRLNSSTGSSTSSSSSSSSTGSSTGAHPLHATINLSIYASPEPHSKRSARLVRKVLCQRCAKTPIVRQLNGDVRIPTKGTLRLRCKVSGNPLPRVEWFRNGKRLRNRGRTVIREHRHTSRLEIRRVNPSDGGYYECRAINVVSRHPSTAKHRVYIIKESSGSGKWQSSSSSTSTTTTRGPLWPHVRPCPIPSFCLNGGTCTLYESVGEYVCQCADGYVGQRCESKDIYLKLTVMFDQIQYD